MTTELTDSIRRLARSLHTADDLDPVLAIAQGRRFVAIGEASHGTHDYYAWRASLSRRLIAEQGYGWVGVEGDWPDCWRLDRWVRGLDHQEADAHDMLGQFERWPTWMWANDDVADFLDWLRGFNLGRPVSSRVGFYGLDVYSLWDSLERIIAWVAERAPDALPDALAAWQCFAPFDEDPQRYAWTTRLVPESCEKDVVDLLVAVRRSAANAGDDSFDIQQNAKIVVEAERYYRAMVRTDRGSWNIRDTHMAATIDLLATRFGPRSKGLIWEHNTHVGDARATSMATQGLVNVGQLLRERYGPDDVLLVGFAGHRGDVLAGTQWGATEQRMTVPPARAGSHEDLLHEALGADSVLTFVGVEERTNPWLSQPLGHRAIGVVYDPTREAGNYVPTVMGRRYDALVWCEATTALRPLHHERTPREPEYETEPTGL